MLPKRNRVTKQEVENLFRGGYVISNPVFLLKYLKNPKNKDKKISFIVPKKVERFSSKRNYLKRLGYRLVLQYFNLLPAGFEGVFTFKNKTVDKNTLKNEIEKSFSKIH